MKNDTEQLLVDIVEEFPRHLYLLGKDMKEDEFIQVLHKENIGKLIFKLKAITDKNENLGILWNRFFENTTQALSDWYSERKVNIKDPDLVARTVISELSVHNEMYANNLDAFRDLILNQKTIEINPTKKET